MNKLGHLTLSQLIELLNEVTKEIELRAMILEDSQVRENTQ